jgi:hypothetical protein
MPAVKRTTQVRSGPEQLIGALIPTPGPRPRPVRAAMPVLPPRRLPTGQETPPLDVARLDRSGRLSARAAAIIGLAAVVVPLWITGLYLAAGGGRRRCVLIPVTNEAKAIHLVYSDTAAKDSIFDWTPTYTSNQSCSTSVNVGFNAGPIQISTDFKVCSGVTVSISGRSQYGAIWTTTAASDVRQIETSYFEKVRHGAIPTLHLRFWVPEYTYKQVADDVWSVTENWTEYQYWPSGTV